MHALAQLLAREPFAVLDGGLATSLESCGCVLGDDPLWSAKLLLEDPETLREIHRRWREAGADVLATASYQASLPGLRARGLSAVEAGAVLRMSVELVREALHDPGQTSDPAATPASVPLIAASVGSYGAALADGSEYRGGYGLSPAALADFHRPRLVELCAAKPDLLAFETFPDRVELRALADLLTELSKRDDLALPPAWVACSLRPDLGEIPGTGPPLLADGAPLVEALAPLLDHPAIAALGVNCVGPREVSPALEALSARSTLPLVAYPNSGERWLARGWSGTPTSPSQFVELARGWFERGARLIGGCCRTGFEHIAALAALRRRL